MGSVAKSVVPRIPHYLANIVDGTRGAALPSTQRAQVGRRGAIPTGGVKALVIIDIRISYHLAGIVDTKRFAPAPA